MAYRFLLEVPESLVDEANVVIGSVGDTQIVVERGTTGSGYDEPAVDLTIAAHSLLVVGALYDWYEAMPEPRPGIALAPHGATRLPLSAFDRGQMVATIRRDQPWVEHTLPKIGDHARDVFPTKQRATAQTAPLSFSGPQGAPLVVSTKRLTLRSRLPVAVKVPDLERAERYYVDFLGMNLLGRERRDDRGELQPVERDYSATHALSAGREADVSYLANGPVTIALVRVGRGARLEPAGGAPLVVEVDEPTFHLIKGEAYMRGTEILGDIAGRFTVRDIFGMVWQFATPADVPALSS